MKLLLGIVILVILLLGFLNLILILISGIMMFWKEIKDEFTKD